MAIMRMPEAFLAGGSGFRETTRGRPGIAPAAPPGSDVTTPAGGVPAAAPAPTATDVAAGPVITLGSAAAVIVAWVVISALHGFKADDFPVPLKVIGDVSTFALFYVAAQAIERAIEPFSNLILKTDTIKKELDHNVATALATRTQPDGEAAAKKQDELDKKRGERGLVLWAVATVLGMGVSGFTGIYFVNAILAQGSTFSRPLDVLITGLVVGGGSKPLHDLISRVQKTKEQTEDPPETNPKK